MGACPECGRSIEREHDLVFEDVGSASNFLSFESAKRFYVSACAGCGSVVGTGVAGAK